MGQSTRMVTGIATQNNNNNNKRNKNNPPRSPKKTLNPPEKSQTSLPFLIVSVMKKGELAAQFQKHPDMFGGSPRTICTFFTAPKCIVCLIFCANF